MHSFIEYPETNFIENISYYVIISKITKLKRIKTTLVHNYGNLKVREGTLQGSLARVESLANARDNLSFINASKEFGSLKGALPEFLSTFYMLFHVEAHYGCHTFNESNFELLT